MTSYECRSWFLEDEEYVCSNFEIYSTVLVGERIPFYSLTDRRSEAGGMARTRKPSTSTSTWYSECATRCHGVKVSPSRANKTKSKKRVSIIVCTSGEGQIF